MKIKKGDKIYPIITGEDVIATKGYSIENDLDSFPTVDDVLDKHRKDIDKLKSNMKYIYSYGGVGGNGSGGSGGGSTEKEPSLYISLGGYQLQSNGNPIVLSGPGEYTIEGNVRNSNGNTFYLKVACGTDISLAKYVKLNEDNQCRYSQTFTLKTNGQVVINFYNGDYEQLSQITQNYIVNTHTFSAKFKYKYDNGQQSAEFGSANEYFIGDTSKTDPYIDVSYKIALSNVSNVKVYYKIGDDVVEETKEFNTITEDGFQIHLEDLKRNGTPFLNELNTGVYDVYIRLSYTSINDVSSDISFKITLIPNHLYINVRNPESVLYDTVDDLMKDINTGENGIPSKYAYVGSYVSFYYKVYEGNIISGRHSYTVGFSAYDEITEEDKHTYTFEDDPSISGNDYSITVQEQIENTNPVSIPFDTVGIKKLVFKTNNSKYGNTTDLVPTVKYIYIRQSVSTIDWYPENTGISTSYFRANQGEETYMNFDRFSSGNNPFVMKTSDSPYTIENKLWKNASGRNTTILSLGMQFSSVNMDDAEILKVYPPLGDDGYSNTPDINLRSDKLFSDSDSQKAILIPYDENYKTTDSSKYHLVQIVRTKIGYKPNSSDPVYATYLYIDGILESNDQNTSNFALTIGKMVFNNVNVSYNLIEIDYLPNDMSDNDKNKNINIDGFIYQYYLKYRETIQHKMMTGLEKTIFQQMDNIKFDGKDVIINESLIDTISPKLPIPTMMVDFNTTDEKEIENLKTNLFKGYPNGDTAFGEKDVLISWSGGNEDEFRQVDIPEISISTGTKLTGGWRISLQGTSTMRNKIKNFSLRIITKNSNETNEGNILMSPNFDPNDGNTFLPEQEWTLKADIADSAHANNTSIGKFVNKVCTDFQTGLLVDDKIKKYIKNTLEGFPFLMFVKIGKSVYYQGVYNFNLGRTSYYNLGYNTSTDTADMFGTIMTESHPFVFAYGMNELNPDLAIGEIQDNFAAFDFHQFDRSVLFDRSEGGMASRTRMFGSKKKMTGINEARVQNTLANFVEGVAKAGAYCFANIGKEPICSKSSDGTECVDRYKIQNQVPDISYQFKYNDNEIAVWPETPDSSLSFDALGKDINNLLRCISTTLSDNETVNEPILDYTSASEYYTICMIFGLVDSILKNMNIKSWDGRKCFVAFYDMDCANGENNAGGEDVSYLAATDYWHSDVKNGYTSEVSIDYDYWNEEVGKGFDFKSSYLFAIVKYAQSLLTRNNYGTLNRYPQDFWAELRRKDGELRNADYFVDNYFVSGIGEIPVYLASLNYQVKYLYTGKTIDDKGVESETETYLANSTAFNGSRIFKVRNWLKKRIHFMDMMFNVQGISKMIYDDTYIPVSPNLNDLTQNPDVVLLTDAFSTGTQSRILSANNALPVKITAPLNTPLVITRGGDYMMYLLAGKNKENMIQLTTQLDVNTRFLGSKEFINLNAVEPFLTSAYQINTDNLEEVVYGGSSFATKNNQLTITSTSVKKIKLDIPTFSGKLIITNTNLYGQAVNSINVSSSGFYGEWTGLSSLQSLDISSLKCTSGQNITISGAKMLTGDRCHISGTAENKTYLPTLSISDVSGNFYLMNTNIQSLSLTIIDGEEGTFEIYGDDALTDLSLTGFKKIKINGCPKLKNLIISETKNKCESIIIDMPYTYDQSKLDTGDVGPLLSFRSDVQGVFDFTSFNSLDTLGLSGIPAMTVLKIPDRTVKISSLGNNANLEFIDTTGRQSCISLTSGYTFFGSPRYAMRQSWGYAGFGVKIEKTDKIFGNTPYTHICIDKECTDLSYTFCKNLTLKSNYLTDSNTYVNTWGQKVKNTSIELSDARWFINQVICGERIVEYYIDDDGICQYNSSGKSYGPDCSGNITTLAGCFRQQDGLLLTIDSSIIFIPDLSKFTSLNDVSVMYYDTKVSILCKELLSLPFEKNTSDNPLKWSEFIKMGTIAMSDDAFENVSYRIDGLLNMNITLYKKNAVSSSYNYSAKIEDEIKFIDILCPKKNSTDTKDTLTLMKSFSTVNVNASQIVNYSGLFNLCPNITSLSGFLNGDLTNSKIDGILKNNRKITYIVDSFNHTGNMDNLTAVDLYNFFNWDDRTDDEYKSMNVLFASNTATEPGFKLNKEITYANFKKILAVLPKYSSITRLSNLFSFCTITNYNNETISLGEETDKTVMDKITNLNALFYKCTATDEKGRNVPLNIGRSFFEKLPGVQSLCNTFYGIQLSTFPVYDFFAKKKENITDVYVKSEGKYVKATLHGHVYNESITSLINCFRNARFVNCDCWFNPSGDKNIPEKDYISIDDKKTDYTTYYILFKGVYNEYTITEPDALTDTENNFTNYVNQVIIPNTSEKYLVNHNIQTDTITYGNIKNNEYWFDTSEDGEDKLDITPAYCCLPPDIFYGCSNKCDLSGVFANTNILGIIPQHLLSKVGFGTYDDMLLNTNILPNVVYYYNKYHTAEQKSKYLDSIKDVELDDTVILSALVDGNISKYTLDTSSDNYVLFRDSTGKLKKRHPRTGDDRDENNTENVDYSKSQFTYVPQNYNNQLQTSFTKAFNFRYNLPKTVWLSKSKLADYGIAWPTDMTNKFNADYDPDKKPYLWPYYVQYFFMNNESINWSNLDSFKYPFITNAGDMDYATGNFRIFSSSAQDRLGLNVWWNDVEDITRTFWHNAVSGNLNMFLNLCGERDIYTGEFKDCGCLISRSLKYHIPKLDGIVSGFLATFMNGRVVDEGVDGTMITSSNSSGEKVIIFTTFGRNIIFPRFSSADTKDAPKTILEVSENTLVYEYMFISNLDNYKIVFLGNKTSSSSVPSSGLALMNTAKYTVID